MPPIFLNYRRRASRDKALIIRRVLESSLGEASTFLDEESIGPGANWPDALRQAVKDCHILLALIHPDWHKDQEESGARSLDQEGDWVRQEIATALADGKTVIPVLLDGAYSEPLPKDPKRFVPPKTEWLPEPLRSLFDNEAVSFDAHNLTQQHSETFIAAVRKQLPAGAAAPKPQEPGDTYSQLLQESLPLPDSCYHDLCFLENPNPYPGIAHFKEETAALFFGRDREIWELYYEHLLKLVPGQVLLLHGASGVGKSSLLSGGLFPRLGQQGWAVAYARRSKAMPLVELLDQQIAELQAQSGSPRLVLLDQVEEMITDPGQSGEFAAFFDRLGMLGQSDLKVVLGFRKEYLYEVKKALLNRRIQSIEFPLHALDVAGIRHAIRGVFDTHSVRKQFLELKNATLDPALVEALMQDISRDDTSHIAPLLQYQLQSLYVKARQSARASGKPLHMNRATYQQQATNSLANFLENEKLAALSRDFPQEMEGGLIDDILYFFSTPELTAATHSKSDLWARYAHLSGHEHFARLIQALVDQYLLLHHKPEGLPETYRLAHDALARIVRARYENSSRPGQQAAFIMRAKEKIPLEKVGFSETDIAIIEAGRLGMGAVPPAIDEILRADASRYAMQRQERFDLAFSTAQADYEHLRFHECLNNLRLAAREGIEAEKVADLLAQLPWVFAFLKDEAGLAGCRELNGGDLPEIDEAAMRKRFFPTMKPVPGGSYDMGSEEGSEAEKPMHRVTVNGFQMGEAHVTCWQYGLHCLATGHDIPRDSGFGRGDRPVVNITWYEALIYCNWLSKIKKLEAVYKIAEGEIEKVNWLEPGYRLPTEAEWEYAAREGGKKVRFGNGKDFASTSEINFDGMHDLLQPKSWFISGPCQNKTTPVKNFSSNALGLFDMAGNVYDWCWDIYDEGYYSEFKDSEADNPKGPDTSERKHQEKVVRGGGWLTPAIYCRCTYRYNRGAAYRNDHVGFRVVRSLTV